MKFICKLLCLCSCVLPMAAQTEGNWTLRHGTLTYQVTHPLHQFEATSKEVKGLGKCHDQVCDFLLAVPVKSFDSGDTNRDLHMLQVVRGGMYPMVLVRFQIPNSETNALELNCDLEIEFAGTKAHFAHVPFHQTIHGTEHHVTGTIPATLTDFKIDPPSFFTVPIKNEIPVRVDLTWGPS